MKKIMSLILALILPITTVDALNETTIDNSHLRLTEKFLRPHFSSYTLDKKPEHIRLTEKYLLLGPNIPMPKENMENIESLNPDLNNSVELPEFFEERNKTFLANPKSNQDDRFNSFENERNYVTSEEIIIPAPAVPEPSDFKPFDALQNLKSSEETTTTDSEYLNNILAETPKDLETKKAEEINSLDSGTPSANEKVADISSEEIKDSNKDKPSEADEILESAKNAIFSNDSFKDGNDSIEKSHIEGKSPDVFFRAKKTFGLAAIAALAAVATSCVTFKDEIQTFMKAHCPEWAPVWIKKYLNKDKSSALMPVGRLTPIETVDIRRFYNNDKADAENEISSEIEGQINNQDKSSALMPVGRLAPIETLDVKKLKTNDVNTDTSAEEKPTILDPNISFISQNKSNSRLNISDSTNETNRLGKECNETHSVNEQEQAEKDANDEIENLLLGWKNDENEQLIFNLKSTMKDYNLEQKKQFLSIFGECYTFEGYLNRSKEIMATEAYANRPWYKKAWCNVKTFFKNNSGKILVATLLLVVVTICAIKLREAYQEYNLEKQKNAALSQDKLELQSQISNLQNDLNNQQEQSAALQQQIADMQRQQLTWEENVNKLQGTIDAMNKETADKLARRSIVSGESFSYQPTLQSTETQAVPKKSFSFANSEIFSQPTRSIQSTETQAVPEKSYSIGNSEIFSQPTRSIQSTETQTIPEKSFSIVSGESFSYQPTRQPIEPQPIETQSIEIQPIETKPVETQTIPEKSFSIVSSESFYVQPTRQPRQQLIKENLDNINEKLLFKGKWLKGVEAYAEKLNKPDFAKKAAENLIGERGKVFDCLTDQEKAQEFKATEQDKELLMDCITKEIKRGTDNFEQNKVEALQAHSDATVEHKRLSSEFVNINRDTMTDDKTDELTTLDNSAVELYGKVESLPSLYRSDIIDTDAILNIVNYIRRLTGLTFKENLFEIVRKFFND